MDPFNIGNLILCMILFIIVSMHACYYVNKKGILERVIYYCSIMFCAIIFIEHMTATDKHNYAVNQANLEKLKKTSINLDNKAFHLLDKICQHPLLQPPSYPYLISNVFPMPKSVSFSLV